MDDQPRCDHRIERNVLGILLSEPGGHDTVLAKLRPDHFDQVPHQEIYKAILAMHEAGEPVDSFTVRLRLMDAGKIGAGPDYDIDSVEFEQLTTNATFPEHVDAHANNLIRLWVSRCAFAYSARLAAAAQAGRYDQFAKISEALDTLNQEMAGDEAARAEDLPSAPVEETVAPFPSDVLPEAFRDLVTVGARAIHCPPDFLGVPLLALAGVAIGNSHAIQIKRGWQERARIWATVVALPGDKKSPALDLVCLPFRERQRQLEAAYRAEMKAWEEGKASPDFHEPEPTMRQVFTTDATLEALADLLSDNSRGILFSRDELTGWVLGMNQYKAGKGADRQNWLSLWNGAPVVINRRGRRHPVLLDTPFVGVVGAMPPDVLSDLSDERGREDGFIHRILFSFPPRMSRKWTDAEVSDETLNTYNTAFSGLWQLTEDRDEDGNPQTRVLTFTHEAKLRWTQWMNEHDQQQDAQDFPDRLRGPWAKLDGYAARLALILHLCRRVCKETDSQEVDGISMAGAVKLINYFKSHVKAVYDRLHTTPEDLRIVAALAWIRRQPGGQTTARAVLHAHVAGVKNASDAKHLLISLEERGYGTTKEMTAKRGRAGLRFTLRNATSDNCAQVGQKAGQTPFSARDNSRDNNPPEAQDPFNVASNVAHMKTHSGQESTGTEANCRMSRECNEDGADGADGTIPTHSHGYSHTAEEAFDWTD